MAAKKPRNPAPPGNRGGVPRTQAQILQLTDALENAMLYAVPRARWGKVLALATLPPDATPREQAEVEPLPDRTVDDYAARVRKRWEEEPLPGRKKARQRQARRLYGQIAGLQAKGLHSEVEKRERLLARIEGTEAPRVIRLGGEEGAAPIPIADAPLDPRTMTTGQRRARIEELRAKRDAAAATAAAVAKAVAKAIEE